MDGLTHAHAASFAASASIGMIQTVCLGLAVSDEEEVVDKKGEIENSCKPQCIKQLLAVRVLRMATSCHTHITVQAARMCIAASSDWQVLQHDAGWR
jgi:hypothetical protein